MRNVKILFFCFIFFLSSFDVCAVDSIEKIKSTGQVKMITNAEFPPFEFIDDKGDIKGIDIDISQKIAEEIGVKLNIESVSFDAILLELESGSADFAAAAMTSSEERSQNFSFSDPYFTTTQRILVKKESKIKSSSDLVGKKIGVAIGTVGDSYCSSKEGFLEPVRFSKPADAVSDLINSRLDAVVVDDLTADQLISGKLDLIKKTEENLTQEDYVIVVRKNDENFLHIINEVIAKLKDNGELQKIFDNYLSAQTENKKDPQVVADNIYYKYSGLILKGLKNTILITVFSLIVGVFLGTIMALFRVAYKENGRLKFLSLISKFYVTVIRGTPVIVQLFIVYYVFLSRFGISDKFLSAVLTFGVNSGAYVAEIVRSGIISIDKGQFEAGYSLGLPYKDVMLNIIMPQATRNILPTLISEFISLLKETSVVGIIGLTDLTRAGDVIRSVTYEAFTPLLIVAIIYLFIVIIFTKMISLLKQRLFKHDIQ
ncbi:MAG: ABC transporter substrate-binding protein/permease [Oscillospiraceae bacterium]|jgi:His/Glu/Gln/Arg/opine family amino acid ABC transporter permease subunit|nr:ABC transporter substrate-binding protein/permease [Oscillospiraceae bacterium]